MTLALTPSAGFLETQAVIDFLNLHSEIVGTLWGTETLSSATDVNFTEAWAKVNCKISPDTGAPRHTRADYCGTPVAPQHLGGL